MGTHRAKWELYLGGLFFNTYPLPKTSVGLRDAMRHTGELVDRGFSPVVFPEGERTKDGALQPFQPGIGVISHQIGLRILPIRITGMYEIWPISAPRPGYGTVQVHFGEPLDLAANEPAQITAALESWYRLKHKP